MRRPLLGALRVGMSWALPASLLRQTVRAESLLKYPIASCHHDHVRWRSRPPHGGGRSRTHTAPACGNVRGGGAARVVWWRGALRPLALGRHAAVCGGGPIRTPYPPAPQAPLSLPAPRGALHRRPCRRRGGGTAAHPWASAPLSRCQPELRAHILTTPPSRGGRPLPPGPTSSPFTPAPDGRCRNTATSRNGHAPPRDRPTSRLPKSAHQLMVYEAAPQPSWPSLAANSGGRLSTCQLAPPPARALARTLRHAGRSALVTTAAMAGGARGSAGSQCGCGHMTSGDRTSRRSAHRHGRRRSASARASLREQTQDKTGTDGIGTRLVKTQCSCSSGFSSELWPWIGSSLKYDCSLVTRGSVRFYIQSFLKITTWTRSSALIGPEGTLLVFLFQAPFTKIDMHRRGIRPVPRHGRDAHHTRTDIHNSNCGNALQALCGSFSCAVHPCARTVDS